MFLANYDNLQTGSRPHGVKKKEKKKESNEEEEGVGTSCLLTKRLQSMTTNCIQS